MQVKSLVSRAFWIKRFQFVEFRDAAGAFDLGSELLVFVRPNFLTLVF